MPPKKKPAARKRIEATKHKNKRKNIPTEELRDFVKEQEDAPGTLLYPRDPSLDPQLVWKGKDEQDRQELEVAVVPVYIQEKVQPRAIIENVRAEAGRVGAHGHAPSDGYQAGLFGDFNNIEFEELIEFYQHEQNWSNRMILGDSLMVMASLAEKEGLKGKVQMIYIDPPYGIRFGSNWQVSTRKLNIKDGSAGDVTRQPEQIRAFRDTWELGIHSYLTYLRDRFSITRELLTETGSVFVQIGDENVHLVRTILDEVFGSENFITLITFQKAGSTTSEYLSNPSDYIIWYAKARGQMKFRALFGEKEVGGQGASKYTHAELLDGQRVPLSQVPPDVPPDNYKVYRLDAITSQGFRANTSVPFTYKGKTYDTGTTKNWKTTVDGMERLALAGRIQPSRGSLNYVRYVDDFPAFALTSIWPDIGGVQSRDDPKVYVVQTSTTAVQRCMLMATDPGDLVLDPTCGSATTATVAERWGRRWITIDTSRVALALARTRLMGARYPYYLLADSPEGVKKEAEVTGLTPPAYETEGDIRKGFVYKRVPHITLKSIANNPEIETIAEKYDAPIEDKLAAVNESATLHNIPGAPWSAQNVPRTRQEWRPDRTVTPVDALVENHCVEYWNLVQQRREEIDTAIARHADTETLYDQPYEDNKRIRVSGPFTVESLSPHRVLAADEERPASEQDGRRESSSGQFAITIIDNLRKAGVQNTLKDERLVFDRLDPFPGAWLQAEGEFTEKDGTTRRVAVSLGPEYGTVGTEQVKEAAKEALKGAGFDLLVVCGFAFDAHAGETAKEFTPEDLPKRDGNGGPVAVAEEQRQYGKLPVLLARMNPDLAMGDELLKKTGAGNLFMVFGEPDLDIEKDKDGKLTVEIRGVDVYDPTTGAIRSASTDDIACWFIDTNYNDESFFVRHAYFTGADEPYKRLQQALRAEIDEAAWSTLYSTRSYPFDPPETGKIAVKVINHYGDEVLKVYEV